MQLNALAAAGRGRLAKPHRHALSDAHIVAVVASLQCANVLLDQDWRASMSDFGLSQVRTVGWRRSPFLFHTALPRLVLSALQAAGFGAVRSKAGTAFAQRLARHSSNRGLHVLHQAMRWAAHPFDAAPCFGPPHPYHARS